LKQKSIYYELMYYIKNNKTYLKLVGEQDRCTGKTHSLILLALKFNCPIVVSNMHNKRHVEDLARSLSNKSVKIIVVNDELIAKRQAILLCDEGINREIINNILKPISRCLVGFVSYD